MPHRVSSGMSVVYGNTAVSKPGIVCIRTAGMSRTGSTATIVSITLNAARTGAPSPTIRNISSADAWGDTTLGATPPSMSPTV